MLNQLEVSCAPKAEKYAISVGFGNKGAVTRQSHSLGQLPGVHILFPEPAISSISSLSLFTNAPGSSS